MHGNTEQSRDLIQPGEAATSAIVSLSIATVEIAKEHPKITGTWLFGLLLTFFATGFSVSIEKASQYESRMIEADRSAEIQRAGRLLQEREDRYYRSKGWFFSCDENCKKNRASYERARKTLYQIQREEDIAMANVKASVGIASEYGVAETRETFWNSFSGGKDFAKRQSMWDLLFTALNGSRRDDNTIALLLRWFFQLLFNFTLGLIGALVVFVFKLWSIIAAYQPNPLTGIAFFAAALLAAASMVATYLFIMYFCAASGLSAIGAAAQAQARIEQAEGRTPGRVQYGGASQHYPGRRPHYN